MSKYIHTHSPGSRIAPFTPPFRSQDAGSAAGGEMLPVGAYIHTYVLTYMHIYMHACMHR